MERNIDRIIEYMLRAAEEHKDAPGAYARWRIQAPDGSRNMAPSEYGVADAANILYTFGRFPRDAEERAAFVRTLRSFQHDDGLFAEGTHHPLHSTAHCIAALELFDAMAVREQAEATLRRYEERAKFYPFYEEECFHI